MDRATYDLLAEPTGDLYRELLDFAVGQCSTALLVVHNTPALGEHGSTLISQLRPFLRNEDSSDRWPGTELGPGASPVSVYRYDYGPECAELLKQATDRLYGWLQPALPEDLCLLRDDGSEWLVTIAHEHISYLCLSSKERARLMDAIPQLGSRLQDSQRQEASLPALRGVMGLLLAWNPYGFYESRQEADVWTAAQAILYALNSREVGSGAELATYIADMYDRWWGGADEFGEENEFTPENCAGVARNIWAWWEDRKGETASE
jgi:hypothetical protein